MNIHHSTSFAILSVRQRSCKLYIARNGLKNYQRNNRPLLGEGVQQFAPSVGTGMLDTTICDILPFERSRQPSGKTGFNGLY